MLKDQLSEQVAGFSPTTVSRKRPQVLIALTYRDISLRLSKTKRAILGIYLKDSGLVWPGERGKGFS